MKVFIVDDEKNNREVLKELIKLFTPELNVVGEADNIDTAFELISATHPDLLFLDIQMPNGNGFTLLKRFDKINFEIIFITSYNQFAIEAIKFNALDYLLKPVGIEDFKMAIQKAKDNLKQKIKTEIQIVNLIQTLENEDKSALKIVAHLNDKAVLVGVNEILYLEADINYTRIYTVEGECFLVAKSIKEFELYLADLEKMVRIHRKYIVNTDYVKSYTKNDPFILTLKDGTELVSSRRKRNDFLTVIGKRSFK